MVMVHIRDRGGILQKILIERSPKTTKESRFAFKTAFTVFFFITVGQPDSQKK